MPTILVVRFNLHFEHDPEFTKACFYHFYCSDALESGLAATFQGATLDAHGSIPCLLGTDPIFPIMAFAPRHSPADMSRRIVAEYTTQQV